MSSLLIRLCAEEPNVLLKGSGTVHLLAEDGGALCGRDLPDAAPGRVDGGDPEHGAWCKRCVQIQSD
jgi:hypothetical protein